MCVTGVCVCVCGRGWGGTTREDPHKQNDDQGAYPQAELRPGSWLAAWLAELAGWLADWLGGWLAGLLRPKEAQRLSLTRIFRNS